MLSQTETERTHAVLFNSNPIFAPNGAWPVGIFAGARSFHGWTGLCIVPFFSLLPGLETMGRATKRMSLN